MGDTKINYDEQFGMNTFRREICAASRPSIEGKTNEEEKEVQTETISIQARPLPNGYVKAKTGHQTSDATYAGWYSAVYMPDTTETEQGGGE